MLSEDIPGKLIHSCVCNTTILEKKLYLKDNVMGESMIANLRRQLEEEEIALKNGLYGLALGTARHDFINARMCRFDEIREALIPLVGEHTATQTVYEHYERAVEEIEQAAKGK